jgi:aryl-alcohol dehydrogenase-like predicted oxidoreductase
MKTRRLGNSDLNVSEISLGSWLTFGSGVPRAQAEACVTRAFDLGINFIDTANIYGRGAAETFLGEVLQKVPRKSYVLATKLYFPMTATDQGLSAAQIKKQIDASLKRLKTDYVDLYQCHRYDSSTPLEETMRALTDVVKEGKARYVGMSEWKAEQIEASFKIPDTVRFVSSQPQYSMLWRTPEKKVIPACEAHGISQIVWSPLAQGVLTGKYLPGAEVPKGTRAASETMGSFLGEEWLNDRVLGGVQKLKPVAERHGITLAQLAIAWVLRLPNVASAIVGATKPEQVSDNAKASGIVLTEDDLRDIDAAIGKLAQR